MRRELLLLSCCVVIPSICSAQEKSDATMVEKKAERNVMLNASDANAPRYIQIGLPRCKCVRERITCRLFFLHPSSICSLEK